MLLGTLTCFEKHQLSDRGKVAYDSIAVVLEVGGNLLEILVPLLLRTEEHLEYPFLGAHLLEKQFHQYGKVLIYR